MSRVDDMNSLDSVALGPEQLVLIGKAMEQYDAPEMYWDDGERDEDFRRETADEIRARMERRLKEDGFEGSAVAFSEAEYRVAIEALVQYKRAENEPANPAELISHLQWFKGAV